VRNGSISGSFSDGVVLSGDGSIVEGLHVSNATALGITARGIVRGNTAVGIFVGIDADGLITGNYVSEAQSGIVAGHRDRQYSHELGKGNSSGLPL
jgi:hypothetical protein